MEGDTARDPTFTQSGVPRYRYEMRSVPIPVENTYIHFSSIIYLSIEILILLVVKLQEQISILTYTRT